MPPAPEFRNRLGKILEDLKIDANGTELLKSYRVAYQSQPRQMLVPSLEYRKKNELVPLSQDSMFMKKIQSHDIYWKNLPLFNVNSEDPCSARQASKNA